MVLIGQVKSGKTYLIRKFVEAYAGPALIFDTTGEWSDLPSLPPSGYPAWRGDPPIVRTVVTGEYEELIRAVRADVRDCLIVFDDLDAFQWRDNLYLRPFAVGYRHYGWDVIVAFHSWRDSYKAFVENASDLFLFKMDEKSRQKLADLGYEAPAEPYTPTYYSLH